MAIAAPLFRDEKTPEFLPGYMGPSAAAAPAATAVAPGAAAAAQAEGGGAAPLCGTDMPHGAVHMDAMAFGMGCCCLQVTFQAADEASSRALFDALAVLSPVFLALTAATPIQRGRLLATDARWPVVAASVDDRTPAERGVLRSPGPAAGAEAAATKAKAAVAGTGTAEAGAAVRRAPRNTLQGPSGGPYGDGGAALARTAAEDDAFDFGPESAVSGAAPAAGPAPVAPAAPLGPAVGESEEGYAAAHMVGGGVARLAKSRCVVAALEKDAAFFIMPFCYCVYGWAGCMLPP